MGDEHRFCIVSHRSESGRESEMVLIALGVPQMELTQANLRQSLNMESPTLLICRLVVSVPGPDHKLV